MSAIWLTVKEFATSKKFITTIAATITAAALKVGLELPTEAVATILSPMVAYLFAQGWADRGKEAAKIAGTVQIATAPETAGTEPPQPVKDKLV